MVENKVREIVTTQALNKMFELDFSEWADDKELGYSQEDKKFLTYQEKQLNIDNNGALF